MNIAVIPWSSAFMGDKIFKAENNEVNIDHRLDPYGQMQREFADRGDECHTIDYYEDLKKVDYFLFFELDLEWLKKLTDLKLNARLIYCNAEPPTVYEWNCPKGYQKLLHYFPYIMTWNGEWVDNKSVFIKNIPYYFLENIGDVPFEKRKLLTSISGNKKSDYPDELYSERERVINYFEKNCPEDFDFYGTGWSSENHPCYRGKVDVKAEVFHRYRFAIAFENTRNVKGYVTEKILDCLTAGIVPVYAGASDIEAYLPKDCFIQYDNFKSLEEMEVFLRNISKEEYEHYLESAAGFLHSDAVKQFAGEEYAKLVYRLIESAGKKDFSVKRKDRMLLKFRVWKQKTVSDIKCVAKRVMKQSPFHGDGIIVK